MTVTVEIDSSWVKFVRSPAFTVVSRYQASASPLRHISYT